MTFASRTRSGARRWGSVAVLTAGALGLAATVAQAEPASAVPAVRGVEKGVAFTASPLADGSGVTTSVAEGVFRLAGGSVTLADRDGRVVATVPTRIATGAGEFDLAAGVSADGRSVTLRPVAAPAVVTENLASFVDEAAATQARKQHNAGIGALVGAGIGAVLGFFLGGVGALITIPIGAGIGALIGYSTP